MGGVEGRVRVTSKAAAKAAAREKARYAHGAQSSFAVAEVELSSLGYGVGEKHEPTIRQAAGGKRVMGGFDPAAFS